MSKQQKQHPVTPETDEFRKRKKELEAELEAIESKLGTSVESFRSDVEGRLSQLRPTYWIRKYPGYSLSVAVFIGFLLSPSASGKSNNNYASSADAADSVAPEPRRMREPSISIPSVVASEIKRMITRKATSFIVDKVEDWVDVQLSSREKKQE